MTSPLDSTNKYADLQLGQMDNQLSALQRQFANPQDTDHKKLKKAAQDFEAIFVQQLLDAMDKTVDRVEGYLDGGHAEETFRGMLNQQIAVNISSRTGGSGFGLAEEIYKQMARNLPNPKATTSPSDAYQNKPSQTVHVDKQG